MGFGRGVELSVALPVEGEVPPLTETQLQQVYDYILSRGGLRERTVVEHGDPRFTARKPVGLHKDGKIHPSLIHPVDWTEMPPLADADIPGTITRDSEVMPIVLANDGTGSLLDADTVDGAHYETGTFTPTLTFGGGSTGITYDVARYGRYARIGNLVFVSIRFNLTSKGSSTGTANVSLPIAATSVAPNMVWPCMGFSAYLTLTTNAVFSPAIVAGSETVLLGQQVGGSNRTNLSDAHFANNTQLRISGYYEV